MSKFEYDGVMFQKDARTIKQAIRAFAYSCDRCCYTGKHINCDYCAIAGAHKKLWGGVNA